MDWSMKDMLKGTILMREEKDNVSIPMLIPKFMQP